MMLTKKQMCKELLLKHNILKCPNCMNKLLLEEETLFCENNHSFDVSRKGALFLINTNKCKPSRIYNKTLFKKICFIK